MTITDHYDVIAYQAPGTWCGKNDENFHPGLHYYVGGNSKVYGAALFRLRERNFKELRHKDDVSPAWPLPYEVFEPYYYQAEELFHVHGQRGADPHEPWSSKPYPYPPVSHEPRIQALSDTLLGEGLHPFHLPLGILLDEQDGRPTPTSPCLRCDTFDGFPCATNAQDRPLHHAKMIYRQGRHTYRESSDLNDLKTRYHRAIVALQCAHASGCAVSHS